MILTRAGNPANNVSIAAKSAVRFRILDKYGRTSVPKRRFFYAHDFCMVGCVGASSDAPVPVSGNANLAQPATLLLRIDSGGGNSQQYGNTIMSTLFVLREDITPTHCREQIQCLNEQMLVLHEVLSTYTESRELIAQPEQFNKFGWLLCILGSLLEQQRMLCEVAK